MKSEFMNQLVEKARLSPKRILLPESLEEKILKVAEQLVKLEVATPVLLGDPVEIQSQATQFGVLTKGFEFINIKDETVRNEYVAKYLSVCTDYSEKTLKRKFKNPLNAGACMVKSGVADCLAAGLTYTTGEVIYASQVYIGLQEGIETVSSIGILEVDGFQGSEGNLLAMSDCAVCPNPTSEELADIAIASADTVKSLFQWEPRVALLSFSTKGSSEHELVEKVRKAVRIANEKRPDLLIDGEFQLDAAIIPQVAKKKVKTSSKVAGRANVVIVPDLNAGNIGVKLVQIFSNSPAHGPLLQGFAKPVTDFSRSAPVEEILGNVLMLLVKAGEK